MGYSKEFTRKTSLNGKELKEIAEIVYDAFERKFAAITQKQDKDEWIGLLHEALSFKHGILYKEEQQILGVALLTSEGTKSFVPLMKLIKLFGLVRGLILNFIVNSPVKSSTTLKIDLLGVSPEARGKGVGSHLIEATFDLAKEKGYGITELEVVDTNPKAKKLYERSGFKTVKTVSMHGFTNRAGFNAYDVMVKEMS